MSEKIYRLRRSLDLTQEELARKVGVSVKTVNRWEAGEREPSGDTLRALATALNTSVAYLMGETENPAPPMQWDKENAGLDEGVWTEGDNAKPDPQPDKLQASQDLDGLIRELASINPDLIVNFRTTKQHWKDLSPDTKKKIAQGMMFVLGLAELSEEDGFRTPKSDEDL